jgi:hypothetical protein
MRYEIRYLPQLPTTTSPNKHDTSYFRTCTCTGLDKYFEVFEQQKLTTYTILKTSVVTFCHIIRSPALPSVPDILTVCIVQTFRCHFYKTYNPTSFLLINSRRNLKRCSTPACIRYCINAFALPTSLTS